MSPKHTPLHSHVQAMFKVGKNLKESTLGYVRVTSGGGYHYFSECLGTALAVEDFFVHSSMNLYNPLGHSLLSGKATKIHWGNYRKCMIICVDSSTSTR